MNPLDPMSLCELERLDNILRLKLNTMRSIETQKFSIFNKYISVFQNSRVHTSCFSKFRLKMPSDRINSLKFDGTNPDILDVIH